MDTQVIYVILGLFMDVSAIWKGYDCRRSEHGTDYIGHVNTTKSGLPCQPWRAQSPHAHSFTKGQYFPDRNVTLARNFCRNPETSGRAGLWCYTTAEGVTWEECDVPRCSEYPECKQTKAGVEYRGHISVTVSGRTCAPWCYGFPDEGSNVCRNHNDRQHGPWCFVNEAQTEWEYCDVPFCKPSSPCLTSPRGEHYAGTYRMTRDNVWCQRWDAGHPHRSNYSSAAGFPDSDNSLEEAADYCRNPGGEKEEPWCYTSDPLTEWDYCGIPACPDCLTSQSGREYAGTAHRTASGLSCQRWDQQKPHNHDFWDPLQFPDATVARAENFCRNPDNDPAGPWCFTSDPSVVRETCGIQHCRDDSATLRRHVKHVVHIGIDGLHPCFSKADPSNILTRLGSAGAYTLDKCRSVLPSFTLPAWTATLCSSPVSTSGVFSNSWRPSWLGYNTDLTPLSGAHLPIPCLADVIQGTNPHAQTAFFYSWEELKFLGSSAASERLDVDRFCEDSFFECDKQNTREVSAYLGDLWNTTESSYTFVYLGEVDEVGHKLTWCKQSYLESVKGADRQVGTILDVIDDAHMQNDVLVVLSTDHGGRGIVHGTMVADDIKVPLFFRGPGIKTNYQLRYGARLEDLAPTIAYAMGYKHNPWWSGLVLREIFEDLS